jgi:multidrug resistance efflux pump
MKLAVRILDRVWMAAPGTTLLGTVGLAAWLSASPHATSGVMGFAEGEPLSIAPTEPARVVSVAVDTGQEVAAGQVVAVLDSSVVDAELEVALAERGELEALIAAGVADARSDDDELTRELDEAVERAQLALAEAEGDAADAAAEHTALQRERARLQTLIGQGLATRSASRLLRAGRSARRRPSRSCASSSPAPRRAGASTAAPAHSWSSPYAASSTWSSSASRA